MASHDDLATGSAAASTGARSTTTGRLSASARSASTAVEGDVEVGGESPVSWLDEHGDTLFGYALSRIGDRHLAEDLVQETLLAAVQARERFEHRSTMRTWLTSILRHKIVDHLRSRRRSEAGFSTSLRVDHQFDDEEALERFALAQFTAKGKWRNPPGGWGRASDEPSQDAEAEELRRILQECLEKLPARSAAAVDMVERVGQNLEQISKTLGVTATNAGVILHRARLALRRCLEANWFRGGR